jgi:hypothetical protein
MTLNGHRETLLLLQDRGGLTLLSLRSDVIKRYSTVPALFFPEETVISMIIRMDTVGRLSLGPQRPFRSTTAVAELVVPLFELLNRK